MSLTGDQVRWVAHLARLELSVEELTVMTEQLNHIVGYVDQLQQLDTSNVEPLAHALPLCNVFRADDPAPSLSVEQALANAPAKKDKCYRVPAVLD
jgi:aspartyl-tRNA(Asn)/glutamyl-tRNA(Gln) amidotransferase subunit C